MARLDISEALGEGFRVIGRRPLDTLVWGLAYFVFAALPVLAIFAWLSHDFLPMMRAASSGADTFDTSQIWATQLKIQLMQPVIFLGSLVGRVLVIAAILRAVLTPRDRGFCYLRFSATEWWVGLVMLVQMVCAWLVMVALIVPAALLWIPTGVAAANNGLVGWEIPLGLIGSIAACCVVGWLVLRFSMAIPLTFSTGTFQLFESWSFTRGHALGLFGLYLVVAVIAGCIAAVVEGLILAVGIGVVAGVGPNFAAIEAMFRQSPETVIATVAPYAIGLALIGSLLLGPFMTLFAAPWARAYAQLAREPSLPL